MTNEIRTTKTTDNTGRDWLEISVNIDGLEHVARIDLEELQNRDNYATDWTALDICEDLRQKHGADLNDWDDADATDWAHFYRVMARLQSLAKDPHATALDLYAFELLDDLDANEAPGQYCSGDDLRTFLLNGARTWPEYSHGGSALIYADDLRKRLPWMAEADCSELLDEQARQLARAFGYVATAWRLIK